MKLFLLVYLGFGLECNMKADMKLFHCSVLISYGIWKALLYLVLCASVLFLQQMFALALSVNRVCCGRLFVWKCNKLWEEDSRVCVIRYSNGPLCGFRETVCVCSTHPGNKERFARPALTHTHGDEAEKWTRD